MRKLEQRLGRMGMVIFYLTAMAALFLAATIIYLGLEYAYLRGYRLGVGTFFG
jgi:hypothetical protein